MKNKKSNFLFNSIAPIYATFYNRQKSYYSQILDFASKYIDLTLFETILDVGCGTGALCSVLNKRGLSVTGVDPAEKMLSIGRNKAENKDINFIQASVLEGLPFEDKSFNISIASYVAHGMKSEERLKMYSEMNRVTKDFVIIYDYNSNRALLTSIVEWFEGGDYFAFIKKGEEEMREHFQEVKVVDVDIRAAWYICKPL